MVDSAGGASSEPQDPATVYNNVARTLTCAHFQISVLSCEEEKFQQRSAQIQDKVDKARTTAASIGVSEEGTGFFGSMFGGEEAPEQASAIAGLSRREIDKLKKEKEAIERASLDISRRKSGLETALADAMQFVKKHINEPITSISDVRVAMKHSMVTLANKVNPKALQCALSLGKLWLRTPTFFSTNGLSSRVGHAVEPNGTQAYSRLPPLRMKLSGPQALESWAIYEEIDTLVDQAGQQEEKAIGQLLALLVDDDLQVQLRQHLMHSVADKMASIERHDQERFSETKYRCALCANWPNDRYASNFKAYAELVHTLEESHEYDEADSGRHSTKMSASRDYAHRFSMARSSVVSKAPKTSPLDRSLKAIDANFADVQSKDKYLHVTPQVFEAIIKIASAGMDQYHQEELVLFGSPELPEINWEAPHWFLRRRAALKICEMAQDGNALACEMICKKLLRASEHWMVRSIVVEEVCHIIGKMRLDGQFFRELLDELSQVLFTVPMISKVRSREMHKLELEQARGNVQRSAEQTFCKEFWRYPDDVRAFVMQDLLSKAPPREGCPKRQVMERILRATSGSVPRLII